jgi:membrane associated rhomboid family serine protease
MIPLYDNNPTRGPAVVTVVLIAANVTVFLAQTVLQWGGASWVIPAYGLVPIRLAQDPAGEAFTIFSSMFMHGSWGHLGWNMLFLHIFGDNVEDALGHGKYIAFYLLGGIGAAACQFLVSPASNIPMVGASGAIAAVLGGYVILHPRAPIAVVNPILPLWLLMGPLIALPAWLVVGEWFFVNLLGGLGTLGQNQGGVAFFAHLGGFVAGLFLIRPMASGRTRQPPGRWSGWQAPPRAQRSRGVFWREDRQERRPFWK